MTLTEICIVVIVGMMVLGVASADAGMLDDIDDVLRTAKAPIGQIASVSALIVSVQTDILGKDNVQAPVNIRKVTRYISPVQHMNDKVRTIFRQIDATL